jgi:hypothetical protein
MEIIEDHGQLMRAIQKFDGTSIEARKYLKQYFESTDEKQVLGYLTHSVADDMIPREYAWAAKLVLDGVDIQCYENEAELHNRIKKAIWDITPKLPEVIKVPVKKTYGGDIEHSIDQFINGGYKLKDVTFDTYEYLEKEKVPPGEVRKLVKHFTEMRDELEQIDFDEQLKEAYAYLGKRNRNSYIKYLDSILDGCGNYLTNTRTLKKIAKPGKKKRLAKVNYMESCDELQLVSQDPTKINGAKEAWIIHEKYNLLIVYRTADHDGLKLEGSSIKNFKEKTSTNKKIQRKFIPGLSGLGKRAMNKTWRDLKRKENTNNGRLNKNHIIVGVFK